MDNQKFYKLGVFYYNPADSRLLIPKRSSSMNGTRLILQNRLVW
ncbi:hypothetical protein EDF67_103317 [Sphingobacterium sp. JUb78]|nr:putative membrane protein [Sphingobacterium kitahiroshimense]TCR11904.1 hypothetical protein EDF67_103317 [Sphingobacterium sp. JUb78]